MTSPTGRPTSSNSGAARPRPGGFTLVELLMVVVISMIAAALAMPLFARSFQNSRLRVSVRTVVTAHRHARAIAALRQTSAALMFDMRRCRVEVVTLRQNAADTTAAGFLETREQSAGTEFLHGTDGTGAAAAATDGDTNALPDVVSELVQPLADGVQFSSVDAAPPAQEFEHTWWINYYPNGTCDEFTIHLLDDHGVAASVHVDPMTGEPEVLDGKCAARSIPPRRAAPA